MNRYIEMERRINQRTSFNRDYMLIGFIGGFTLGLLSTLFIMLGGIL
jgi:hypothetical protein